jgi:RNA polymerase sigma-70 factor (ECF subfamily)
LEPHDSQRQFAQTQWSLVLHAATERPDDAGTGEALERLCRIYWPPIYAFLRRAGRAPAEAEDLTQEFFASLLRRRVLAVADARRGRFRTFLLAALQNFLRDQHDRATALKRGGGGTVLALDSAEAERQYLEVPAGDVGPEACFDRRWAMQLVARSLVRLEAEHVEAGKAALFAVLQPFVLTQPTAGDYAQLAQRLGLREGTVAVTVHRLRVRCRELLRDELAETVDDPAAAEAEFRALFQ